MHGLREHVDGRDFLHGIAKSGEDLRIAGEGGHVAGDVDDARGLHAGRRGEDIFAASGADGVHDDDVGAKAFFVELWHEFSGISGVEFGIFDMIEGGILLRIFDGFFHDLDADDAAGFLRKTEGNGARSAVGVDHGLSAVEVGIGEGFFIEELSLRLVHLKEGEGGDFEGDAAKGRGQGLFAPEMMDFFSEDGIAFVALDIVIDGDDFGEKFSHFRNPEVGEREFLRSGHDDGHDFAVIADASHDVADAAAAGFFIVAGELMACHEALCKAQQTVVFFFLNGAARDRDDLMAALPVVAKDGAARHLTDRDGHFIAVVPWMLSADDGADKSLFAAADAHHHVFHAPLFHGKLAFIGEVGDLTAAAGVADRAGGRGAMRGGGLDGDEPPCGVGFLRGHDHGLYGLAGESTGDEDGEVIDSSDAFAVDAKVADGKGVCFVDFDGNVFLRHRMLRGG